MDLTKDKITPKYLFSYYNKKFIVINIEERHNMLYLLILQILSLSLIIVYAEIIWSQSGEINDDNFEERFNATYLIKLFTGIISFSSVYFLIKLKKIELRIQEKTEKYSYYYWFDWYNLLSISCEILILIIHVPIHHSIIFGQVYNKSFDYFVIICTLKVYLIFKAAIIFSPANNFTMKFLLVYIRVKSDKMFRLKYFYKHHQFVSVSFIFSTTILMNSYILYLIERTLEKDTSMNNFQNSLWGTLITLFTVGFGDIIPETKMGKIFALYSGLLGIFFSTIIINTIFDMIVPTPHDQRILSIIKSNQIKIEYTKNANRVILRFLIYTKHKLNLEKIRNNNKPNNKLIRIHYTIASIKLFKQSNKWRDCKNLVLSYTSLDLIKGFNPVTEINDAFDERIIYLNHLVDELNKKKSDDFVSNKEKEDKKQYDDLKILYDDIKKEHKLTIEKNQNIIEKLNVAVRELDKSPKVNLYNNIFT